jgi:hypothetical protein
MRSPGIVVDLHVAVNNIKSVNVAMERQQWVPFTLLPSYKIVRTAVNNNVFRYSCEVTDIVIRF